MDAAPGPAREEKQNDGPEGLQAQGPQRGIAMQGVGMVTRRVLGEFEREPFRHELSAMLGT